MMALMAMGGAWFTQGNPLGGEARGASSFKSAFIAYEIGNIVSSLIPILVLWPVINAIGFQFFQAQNYLFFAGDAAHAPIYPELALWVYFATGNKLLSVFIITMALLVTFQVNILLNGFLNCSRPLFAMAFDRMLPSAFAKLSTRYRLPLVAYGYVVRRLLCLVYYMHSMLATSYH